ncbi:MAG: aldehyde ferredoxin oxidoreductase C-terminal domain-containing protein [Syntrophales bacterium]|jgi:aldehyde:ferredoxin oxidoreductase|nr:aldehyde ferredoxin oxidoreductase C-terminal domain-containing protein [Syntrophales bacterium]
METKTYGFFGWDAKGIPTEATLKAYGLDYLIADVNAAKKKYNL